MARRLLRAPLVGSDLQSRPNRPQRRDPRKAQEEARTRPGREHSFKVELLDSAGHLLWAKSSRVFTWSMSNPCLGRFKDSQKAENQLRLFEGRAESGAPWPDLSQYSQRHFQIYQ